MDWPQRLACARGFTGVLIDSSVAAADRVYLIGAKIGTNLTGSRCVPEAAGVVLEKAIETGSAYIALDASTGFSDLIAGVIIIRAAATPAGRERQRE